MLPSERSSRLAGIANRLPWPLFLIWTAVMFALVGLGIGEAEIIDWLPGGATSGTLRETPPSALEAAFIGLLRASDCLWFLLAGVNTYLLAVRIEGLSTARRWAAVILAGSAILAWIGATAGWPFGPLAFTKVLGFRIAKIVPLSLPLLWLTVILSSRETVLKIFPHAGRLPLSLGVSLLAVVTDLNLENVAWKIRAYWIWYPLSLAPHAHVPGRNYVTWALAAFAFTMFLGENHVAAIRRSTGIRLILILLLLNAVFAVANIVRWLGR